MKSNIEKWDEGVKKDGCVTQQQILDGNSADTSDNSKVLNIPIITAPLLWKDVLDDFYVEYDKEISNGEFTGKMILVFRDWLEKNYKVPELNGR